MDKYEYRVKTEQMLEYTEGKQYKKAMEIADTIDWRRVKNASMLNTVSEIYEFNGEFQKSRDILFLAYDRAPGSRKIIYRLGLLALKVKDIEEASDCYEEFVKAAPKDPNQHILKYKILKAQRSPIAEQIAALEDFKKAEYVEKWAYELASLYQEAGMTSKCLEECDDLILWFSEGKYVYQAMELKMRYKPLTPLQQEKYDSRPGAPARPKVQKTQNEKPQQKTSPVKQTEELSLQKEDEKSDIEETEPEEVTASEEMAQPEESGIHTTVEPEAVRSQPEVRRSPITKVVKGATLEEALANGVAIASGLNIEEEAMVEREEELLTGVQMKIEDILQEWEEKQKMNADAIEEQKKKDEERLGRERQEALRRKEAQKLEVERKAAEAAKRKAREEEERAREEEKQKEEEARKAAQAEALKKASKPQATKRDAEEQKKILESKTQRLPDDILELVEQLESRVGGADIEDDMDDDDLEAEVFGGVENDFAGGGFARSGDHDAEDGFVEEEYDADDFAEDDYEEDFAEDDYAEGFEEAEYDEEDFAEDDEPAQDYAQGFEEAEYDEEDFAEDDEPVEDHAQEESEAGKDFAEDGFVQEDLEGFAEDPGADLEAEHFAEDDLETEDIGEEEDFAEDDLEAEDIGEEEEFAEDDLEAEDFGEEEEFAEDDLEAEDFGEEEDFAEDDLEAEDFEEEDFEEADIPDDVYEEDEGYIEDYGEDDFDEEDFDEEDFDEEDFEEEDFEEEDFEEEDYPVEDEDEFEEEEEEDFDVEKFLAENIPGKSDDGGSLEIEEPSEAEIQKRIKKSKGGVPFDTGFVVTGRYDLSATSEIGLKAGLTEEQKKLFSYFVPVRGMSEQIVEVLDNDRRAQREGTSKTGNLLVIGRKGSGKTVLAVDIVKAIQKQRNLKQGKVAIVTGDSLNKKELANIIQKLRGGAIIIEKAGKLNSRTIKELSYLMEKKTGEMLFVLEDQRKPLERILTANPDFKRKFTSRLELPVFINDELVTFGQTYAKENGYKLDELGILALYSRIDVMQREDHAVTVAEVKEIMDEAIAHSQKANVKHLARRMFGKSTDESNRVILKEEDFKI